MNGTLDERFPVEWTRADIAGKTPLSGPGNSFPVVWGDRIFATQFTDGGNKRFTVCLNREGGSIVWQREADFTDAEPTHRSNPYS